MKPVRHLVLSAKGPASGDVFRRTHPPRSIALDGYLAEGPWFDPVGLYMCANHHEGVDRLATRCTAAQIAMAVRMGRLSAFFDGKAPVHVWYNDIDPDVLVSLWILEHQARMRAALNPLFNKLLFLLDMLDTTAATYPFPIDFDLGEYHWVFEPYFRARENGAIDRKNIADFEQIIDDCFLRIEAYLAGKPGHIEVVTTFDTLALFKGWGMFRQHGNLSRAGIVAEGHFAFVLVRERPNGNYTYTVQRTCDGVLFPVPEILKALTAAEGGAEPWGGGDTVGGSPRVAGSSLSPDDVAAVINRVLLAATVVQDAAA